MKGKGIFGIIVLGLLLCTNIMGQGGMNSSEESDPQAKAILNKIKKKFESNQTWKADFDLILDLPDQEEEIQKGYIKQKDDKFMANINEQEIICDGSSLWVYLKSNNEVQINDFDPNESGDFLSPKDMFRIYESEEFVYAITGEERYQGTNLTLIEFKPLDPNSEYSKMRIAVDEKAGETKSIKVFSKDGSRYTLVINKLNFNISLDDADFVFDANSYPGVRIEDLRLD